MAGVVSWCFHSPRRLLLLAGALVVGLIAAGAAVRAVTPAARGPGERSTGAGSVVGSAAAVGSAVTFTRAWASKPASVSVEQWRQRLQPLATPDLVRLLADTDPASLPGGMPTGQPRVRFQSLESALVEVPLSTARSVLVTVVLVGGHWLASDVQPLAGDVGAASGPASGAG